MAITSIKTGSSFTNLVKYNDFLGPNSAYIPSSYESIATVTPSGGPQTITFSSIPSTYQHLQIRMNWKPNNSGTGTSGFYLRVNGATGNNATAHQLAGNGSTTNVFGYSSTDIGDLLMLSTPTGVGTGASNIFSASIIDVHNYISTTQNKTFRHIGGYDANGSGSISLNSGVWLSTSAITQIEIKKGEGFADGSTFALYGIKQMTTNFRKAGV